MSHVRICLLGLFLFQFLPLSSQVLVQAAFHRGTTLKIHPSYPPLPLAAKAGEITVLFPTSGQKSWHEPWGYPMVGVQASASAPGNPDAFGSIWGVTACLDQQIFQAGNLSLRIRFNTGMARQSRPYHPISNQANTALAARWVNLTQARLYLQYSIARYQIQFGGAYWHYSSAKARVPNFGINEAMLHLGVSWISKPLPTVQPSPPVSIEHRIRAALRFESGRISRKTPGGPQYWAIGMTSWARYHLRPHLYLDAGAKVFFEESLVAFAIDNDFGLANPQREAIGIVAFGGVELLMGRLGLRAWLGPYLKQPILMEYDLFTELGLQYYFRPQTARLRPFLSVGVQAHGGEADFAVWGLGVML